MWYVNGQCVVLERVGMEKGEEEIPPGGYTTRGGREIMVVLSGQSVAIISSTY